MRRCDCQIRQMIRQSSPARLTARFAKGSRKFDGEVVVVLFNQHFLKNDEPYSTSKQLPAVVLCRNYYTNLGDCIFHTCS